MPRRPLGLLSFGVLVVVIAVLLIALETGYIKGWHEFLSLVLTSYGAWIIVLAGIRARAPEKYERGALSTFVWGFLFVIIGGVWYLNIRGLINLILALALILVGVGTLAMISALRTWRK
jgi:hypothetical protein